MGEEERSEAKKESWSHALPGERETLHQTDLMHQWYVRTYVPQAILSVGNCGPGEEDKSLEGLLLATDKNVGGMAKENVFLQSGLETTVDAGTEFRLSAANEILCTTPGQFEVATGSGLELLSFGPLAQGLSPAPFTPILGDAEDGGLATIHGVEDTRKQNHAKLDAAKQALDGKHHSDHGVMSTFGAVFAGVEAIMGGFFAFKAKKGLATLTGGLTSLGGVATFAQSRYQAAQNMKDGAGLISVHANAEVNVYAGEMVSILAGKYTKVEACYRVFIESAGMVSAAATIFTAFGAINAEVMGGLTAGLLAGGDAEVNGGRHVIIEAQKGSVFIETHGSDKGIEIEAKHGSHITIDADGDLKLEAKKEIHVSSETAVHVAAKKHVLIEATESSPEVHITAKDGVVTIHAKSIQLQGDEEVSLLVGSSGVTVKGDGVMINGSHKFAGGKLDSVTAGALAAAKKTFNSMISKLNQQYGQLKDRANRQKAELKLRKTGRP